MLPMILGWRPNGQREGRQVNLSDAQWQVQRRDSGVAAPPQAWNCVNGKQCVPLALRPLPSASFMGGYHVSSANRVVADCGGDLFILRYAGGPNTNASQFFITYAKHPTLDGAPSRPCVQSSQVTCSAAYGYDTELHHAVAGVYTIFGHVIDGMDTLDKMEKIPSAGQFTLRIPSAAVPAAAPIVTASTFVLCRRAR